MKKLIVILLVTLLGGAVLAQQNSTKRAYLGVMATEVDDALASHLKLDKEKCFILKRVVKESPASNAGLQKHDILLKINSEEVDSTAPLSAAVTKFNPEDKVKLSILRGGEAMDIEVTLGENAPQLSLADMKDRIKLIMPDKNNGNDIQIQILENMEEMKEFQKKIRESFNNGNGGINIEIQKALEEMAKANQNHFKFDGSVMSHINTNDGEHNISITVKDGNKSAVVKDKEGKIIFEGDINTEVEIEAIPESVREKVKKLQNNVRIMPKQFH